MQLKHQSLLTNYIFNFIKTFSGLAFPIITFVYSARILGVDGVGQVNFVKSIITYFILFAMLGMNYYGTRETAKLREDRRKLSKFVQEMLLINCTTTVLSYTMLFLSIWLVPKLRGYQTLLVVNSAAILLQGMGMEWLYQGLEEYRYITIRSLIFQFLALVALVFFVRKPDDVVPYAAVSLLATSGSYVLNFANARKYVDFCRFDHYEIKKHLSPLLWLFALVVSMELYTVLDSTMLGFIQGDAAVGRYTAAVRVNKIIIALITAIGTVLIPRISFYIGQGEHEKVRRLVEKAYNYTFLLSIPASIGLFILSDEIILLFSGAEFYSAAFTMRLLTPIVLVIPFSMATNQQTLVPMGHEKWMLLATSLGAITNLISNAILIPRFAENGAAIATVLAETVVATVSYCNASRFFCMKQFFKKYCQYWVAAAPIPLIAYVIKILPIYYMFQILLIIFLSCGNYFFILWKMKNQYMIEVMETVRDKLKSKETEYEIFR